MRAIARAAFRRARPGRDAGQAMILVVGFILLATLVPMGVYLQAVQQFPLSRHDQDYQNALAAAEAGVDDYINRLDQNQNYFQYGAPPLPAPPDGNGAFTGWVSVQAGPSTVAANVSSYRYTPDTSQLASTGVLYLQSTGQSNGVYRTINVGLRRKSFLDYLYDTNYETADPATYADPATATKYCKYHHYDYNPYTGGYGPDPNTINDPTYGNFNCTFIYFKTGDVLNGPAHSDDDFYYCGTPSFNGPVDSADPKPPRTVPAPGLGGCSGTPSFARPGDPALGSPVTIPNNLSALQSAATIGQAGAGCTYTGPTDVALNSDGTMTVNSPNTKLTNSGCGPGSNLSLPPNGVIWVQPVPANPSDPNYSATCKPNGVTVLQSWGTDTHTNCTGDATVHGTLSGQLTIASANDTVVTGNVVYKGGFSGTDVLGLAATNYVEINNPNPGGGPTNVVVDAAILASNHSFIVMNYAACRYLGTLNLTGALGQPFRGPVGTFGGGCGNTGYTKNYVYDNRLHYLSPPLLLSIFQTAWEKVSFAELPAKY
jgi:hypothetical protein